MGKKCVRATMFVCLIATMAMAGTIRFTTTAQTNDPSTLPLLTAGDLDYMGGFRLPAGLVDGDSFSIGGRAMTFNPVSNSLFVSTRAGRIAEVNIPPLVNSTDVNALTFAGFLQPFADPTEGHLSQIASDGVAIDGLMVHGNRLYGTASIYYDANNTQRQSHYSRSLQLNQPSFSGWSQVWETGKTGFVSGFMSLVPAAWQAQLGGLAVTGQCCIPIAGRTSWGPAAFSFNPASIGQATVAATPLLYYTGEHPTLGAWDGSNPTYGATAQVSGMAIIAGTRTALYVGRNGTGPNCYGNGTSNQSLHGTYGADGAMWCYDPTTSDKGSHAYPYHYQVWAYDLNEFTAVKEGRKQPWEVVPYGVWPIDLPTPELSVKLGGVGYDAARQILYVSQMGADKDGYSYRPIIHGIQIDIPAVAPVATVHEVTITSDKAAPQQTNVTSTFSATAVDGVAPYQYKWFTHDGRSWTPSTDWTSSSQITWTPATANPDYRVGVWVRSAGNAADVSEAETSVPFAIVEPVPAASPVHNVTVAANMTAPQMPGTTVTFSAAPTGGAAPYQYKWWIYEGGWKPMGGWTPSSTFAWTPEAANAGGRITVWVRSAGNLNDQSEAAAAMDFVIAAPATATPPVAPVTPAPSATVTAVAIGADKVAPQPPGTPVTFNAAPTGGAGPHQYKWWIYEDGWKPAGGWTTANTFTWTPAAANAGGRITVWVRSAGNTADQQEASGAMDFVIAGPAAVVTPPPAPPVTPAPSARISAVTIGANKIAPQPAGTTTTFTALPAGGVAPYQYKWWVYDGAAWVPMTNWTASSTFAWTSATANAGGRVTVWARSAGSIQDEAESVAAMDFVIGGSSGGSAAPSAPVTSTTIAANLVAPQPPGTTVTFTATPSGGTGPYQYKWWIYDGAAWVPITGWTTSHTFHWTPAATNLGGRVTVWVRSAGATADVPQAAGAMDFVIR